MNPMTLEKWNHQTKFKRTQMQTSKHHGRMAARMIKSLHAANNEVTTAAAYAAAKNWSDATQIVGHLKGIVGGLTTAELALSPVAQDFSAAVRPLTVLGRLQGLRRVPPMVRVLTAHSGTSAAFISQGGAIPVSAANIAGDVLYPRKVSGISVVSDELLSASSPVADDLLTLDLASACAQAVDVAFLDPDNAGITDEKPASVTNGVTPLVSTGSGFVQVDADLQAMLQQVIAAGSNLASAAWIIRPQTAVYLASLRDTSGALAYPAVTVLGGTLKGLPVLVTGNLPDPGSPASGNIVLLDASQVALADEGAAELEISRNGALQLLDNPTNDAAAGTATNMVSLFQTACAGFRGTLWMNWMLRRPFVSVLASVTY